MKLIDLSETRCDYDRRIGAGSRPIKPKTRAYKPDAAFEVTGCLTLERDGNTSDGALHVS